MYISPFIFLWYAITCHWRDLIFHQHPLGQKIQLTSDSRSQMYISPLCFLLRYSLSFARPHFFTSLPWVKKSSWPRIPDLKCTFFLLFVCCAILVTCHWRDLICSPVSLRSNNPADLGFQISNVYFSFYFWLCCSVSFARPHFFTSLPYVKKSSWPWIPDLKCIFFFLFFVLL